MLVSPGKNGLDSLFKEVRAFKVKPIVLKLVGRMSSLGEFVLPEMAPGVLPRTPILHFKQRVWGS